MRASIFALILGSTVGLAQTPASPDYLARIRAIAERQVGEHPSIAGRDHSVQWEPAAGLIQCPVPARVSVTNRDRLWGEISVALTCPSGKSWTRTMKAYVSVPGEIWRAKTSILPGSPFKTAEWVRVTVDLAKLPEPLLGSLADSVEALNGFEARRAIPSGRPLVLTDWQKIAVIKRGATVKVTLRGSGFDIAATGVTLDEGAVGDTVRVRTPEGKVLEGVAEADGSVLVRLN